MLWSFWIRKSHENCSNLQSFWCCCKRSSSWNTLLGSWVLYATLVTQWSYYHKRCILQHVMSVSDLELKSSGKSQLHNLNYERLKKKFHVALVVMLTFFHSLHCIIFNIQMLGAKSCVSWFLKCKKIACVLMLTWL